MPKFLFKKDLVYAIHLLGLVILVGERRLGALSLSRARTARSRGPRPGRR